jgi:DNA-binding Lrp family transcriptional regulator
MFLKILADGLDDTDLRIIDLLNVDGRMTDTQIAKSVGLSKTSVRLRKMKLIQSGMIKILGIPILRKLNLIDSDVFIKFKLGTSQKIIEESVERLEKEEYVYEVNRYLNGYDLRLSVLHKDLASLKTYIQDLFKDFEYIEKYQIYPVIQTDKAFGVIL